MEKDFIGCETRNGISLINIIKNRAEMFTMAEFDLISSPAETAVSIVLGNS